MKYPSKLILTVLLFIAACRSSKVGSVTVKDTPTIYRDAIKDAMYPETAHVDSNLIAITAGNSALIRKTINDEEYILVVSWKSKNYYPDSGAYNTDKYEIWVTAAPELLNRIKQEKTKDVNFRLKQMLGLSPVNEYNFFIEFWVRPADLFRPCPDKEINDTRCNTCFTAKDSLDTAYVKWVNEARISRYYPCDLYQQYPWTALGYTYDWYPGNKTHRGLSEFVIGTYKTVYVNKVYPTEEYLNKK